MRGCSFLPDGRMVFSCTSANTVSFINKEGVELFQIGKDKTGSCTFDAVYIKDRLIPQLFRQTFECWWL
jgi:protein involved in ribonucleotide reduction